MYRAPPLGWYLSVKGFWKKTFAFQMVGQTHDISNLNEKNIGHRVIKLELNFHFGYMFLNLLYWASRLSVSRGSYPFIKAISKDQIRKDFKNTWASVWSFNEEFTLQQVCSHFAWANVVWSVYFGWWFFLPVGGSLGACLWLRIFSVLGNIFTHWTLSILADLSASIRKPRLVQSMS